MVKVEQGDIWWVDLPEPVGSEPGYHRPAIVVQCDDFNRSLIRTVVCVMVTSNLNTAQADGNVFLPSSETGLPKDSVANVSQVATVDRSSLVEYVGQLSEKNLEEILNGVEIVIGRKVRS
ncbi:MAG: type II toxin-antitoxin system PemK/MazF family toxin [Chloroflexota bacterium]